MVGFAAWNSRSMTDGISLLALAIRIPLLYWRSLDAVDERYYLGLQPT
jgi:hypothetical protein